MYNDLSLVKKINGIPVDLDYFQKLTENDELFKSLADSDEDLSAVDREVLPVSDGAHSIGNISNRFDNGFFYTLDSSKIKLLQGTLLNPAIEIGTAGLASIDPGSLSYVSGGYEPFKMKTDGVEVNAGNDIQIQIRNTLENLIWRVGCGLQGFRFENNNQETKAIIGDSGVQFFDEVSIPDGTELNPSYTFASDQNTGMYKDNGGPVIKFSLNGNEHMSIASASLDLKSDRVVIENGTLMNPSITFSGSPNSGIRGESDVITFIANNKALMDITEETFELYSEGALTSVVSCYSDTDFVHEIAKKSNGTQLAPLPVPAGDDIFVKKYESYTDEGFKEVATIAVSAIGDHGAGNHASAVFISAIGDGDTESSEKLMIGGHQTAGVHSLASVGSVTTKITTGTNLNVDVKNISKIMVDTSGGSISIDSFSGSKEGQVLQIYNKTNSNNFTLKHNGTIGSHPVLLKGSSDFTITADYGGITLAFDEGAWREVSRS